MVVVVDLEKEDTKKMSATEAKQVSECDSKITSDENKGNMDDMLEKPQSCNTATSIGTEESKASKKTMNGKETSNADTFNIATSNNAQDKKVEKKNARFTEPSVSRSTLQRLGSAPVEGFQKPKTLHTWVKVIREQLELREQAETMQALFSNCKSDEDRVSLVYDLPIVHQVLDVRESYKGKDEEIAKSFRQKGNQAFQKKDYDLAIKMYSESIRKAPSSDSTELPLAFANRAAVLYHKQQNVLCLQDIRQAFKHNYPDHLCYKLYERRGKAFYCLRRKEDAINAFHESLNALDKSQLDESKLSSIRENLKRHTEKCRQLVAVYSIKSPREFNHSHGPVPVISDPRNSNIPCMGNSLVVQNSVTKGRGLYSTRNIEVGEVLIVEKPYASITLSDHNLTHCHHCCNRVSCPLPCHQCSGVVFCSEECQQTAWESYHFAECKYHDLIQQSELGMGHLALRIVLKAGHKYLNEYRKMSCENSTDPNQLGCNKDGVYNSNDYHSVYNLVGHTQDRSPIDLFRRTVCSVFLLKCIENSGFFKTFDRKYDMHKEMMYIGGHILRHLQMLPCNAHEVSEFVYKTYNVHMSEPEEVGSAIYSTLSLINHSCDPSVVRHSYGNECVVRAIRNIAKGEEVFDNYGVLYPVMSKPMRQEKLHSQYFFMCNCQPCFCNWPMYDKIRSENPVLKCKKCKNGRIMIPADNQTSRAICADCREVTDVTPDLLHLSKSENFYQGSLDKVLKGEGKMEALPFLIDHLRLIDRLLVRPWKDYNDCQEAIKQCFSTMANCIVLDEPDSDDEELMECESRKCP